MAVVLPAPAGPTSTSTTRPDPATIATAAAWSAPSSLENPATVNGGTVGPVVVRPRSSSLASASSRAWEV